MSGKIITELIYYSAYYYVIIRHINFNYRCFSENCTKRFNSGYALREHQITHFYISNEFHLTNHAFQGTTLILRKELQSEDLDGLDFICLPASINEIRKIITSEVSKKTP